MWHGVRALGAQPGDEVALPAYHCGAEVEALARAGLTCVFYDLTERLEPDPASLEAIVSARTRFVYLIHYFGFPQDTVRWRRWADDHRLLLIEDAAHAWLCEREGAPVGSTADLAIFCFHKAVGTPDGAAVWGATVPPPPPRGSGGLGAIPIMRLHAKWLAARARWTPRPPRALAPFPETFPSRDWQPDSAPAHGTSFLLRRLPVATVVERRRANYTRLLESVGELPPAGFRNLPEGVSPYAFPIVTDHKARVQAHLRQAGVFARDWSAPHPLLAGAGFPLATSLRGRLLMLPVHQELRPRDLDHIAGAVRTAVLNGESRVTVAPPGERDQAPASR